MRKKLKVQWCPAKRIYLCTHPQTNVCGEGTTPGEAIRNWQYWWTIPY